MLKKEKKKYYPGFGHMLDLRKGTVGTTLISDEQLDALLRYLNEAGRRKEGRRIVGILEEMLKLEKAEEPVFTAKDKFVLGRKPPAALRRTAKWKEYQELEKREALLNKQMVRYRFSPVLQGYRRSAGQPGFSPHWLVFWRVQSPGVRRTTFERGQLKLGEIEVIQTILDFARAGYLGQLRRCSHCQKWLYAKFRHQSFCSTDCQQKHYTHREEWKAHRRKYMREYYRRTKYA